ncbi:MAG: tripartite tricarboxylate transporter substrate binding protein [Acetobacteraceae bacterium]|nr:tripartite tricarboxylate transporter substrate binding protein [Acetobacteraceae bacterium]
MRLRHAIATLACMVLGAAGAAAQAPITLVVPFAPGGPTDLTARVMAPELSAALGASVVVKNTTGASGTIGGAEVARAAPDGQTLFFTPVGPMAIQPNLQRGIRYAASDFAAVCQVASAEVVMMTPKTSGFRTLADVLARARAEGGNLPFGSSGIGTIPHISMVALQRAAGVRMLHVPFRGGGEVMLAFQQGALALFSDQPGTVRQHDLHVIAVFAPQRSADFPDAPTMRELGFDLSYAIWTAIFAPAATPVPVLERLEAACAAALRRPAVTEGLKRLDTPPVFRDRRALAAFLAEENVRYRDLIEAAGMRQAE